MLNGGQENFESIFLNKCKIRMQIKNKMNENLHMYCKMCRFFYKKCGIGTKNILKILNSMIE